MSRHHPRLVVAAPHSGAGKTSVSLGLVVALRRRGLRVQTFKVGPDYLDPTYLARASGCPCYNLDGWMTSETYVRERFAAASADADISVIEGVMGLFDGAEPTTITGSTAEIAAWLRAPVLLLVDAKGAARSLAAVVEGFARFEPGVAIAGVVANRVGSPAHAEMIAAALRSRSLPPMVGAIRQGALPSLASRHLGLVSADEQSLTLARLEELGAAVERTVDLSRVVALANGAPSVCSSEAPIDDLLAPTGDPAVVRSPSSNTSAPLRLGLAEDEAFHFYYQDNLRALERQGCELVRFSPLRDARLPEGLSALYVGGGYPEVHAEALAGNRTMLEDVRRFAASGRPTYAECGGLMYLSEGVETLDGRRHPLAGILPCWTRMCAKCRALGYAEVELSRDSLWGERGSRLRGHEFHYSELVSNPVGERSWTTTYDLQARRHGQTRQEGFQRGNVLASYVHLHFASRPEAIRHFIRVCQSSSCEGAEPCRTNL